jgi:hypothetical protein
VTVCQWARPDVTVTPEKYHVEASSSENLKFPVRLTNHTDHVVEDVALVIQIDPRPQDSFGFTILDLQAMDESEKRGRLERGLRSTGESWNEDAVWFDVTYVERVYARETRQYEAHIEPRLLAGPTDFKLWIGSAEGFRERARQVTRPFITAPYSGTVK